MNQIIQHSKQIEQLIREIKSDPILNALVEEDRLKTLFTNVDCLVHDCVDECNFLYQENLKLKEEVDSLTFDVENLKYENDRLNEVIY